MRAIFSNIVAIYRRELQSYFGSPFIYVIAGIFWFLAGVFFLVILVNSMQDVAMREAQQAQMGMPSPPRDLPYEVLQSFLGALWSLFQVILPILSMGLYSEERRRGTLELLATSPITNWCVGLGKWLAVVTVVATFILPLMTYEIMAFSAANPPMNYGVMLLGHLGLLLAASAILALGLFISSLTDSVILSAIITFAVVIMLSILDFLSQFTPTPWKEILSKLSLAQGFSSLTQGYLDGSAIILFASYVVLGIFLTAQSIDALRFQRS
jgi:ABC-2 type transport system permease protein